MKGIVLLVIVLSMLSVYTPVLAKKEVEPFYAEMTVFMASEGGRVWIDEEGITHIRNLETWGMITLDTGDEFGFFYGVQNMNLDYDTMIGDGTVKGSVYIPDMSVKIFDFIMHGIYDGESVHGTFQMKGVGDNKGIKIKGTVVSPHPGLGILTGTIKTKS